MQGFEFQPGDAEALRELCLKARKAAKNNPCYRPIDVGDERLEFRFGNWFARCSIDKFSPDKAPTWHGSVSILEEVGEQDVQLESGIIIKVPQDAMLATESWTAEHFKQARYLLGELLGPVILEEGQQVVEHTGLFALHYITPILDS